MDTRTLPAVRRVRHGQQRHKCGPPPAIDSAACSRRYHCSNSHRRFASAQVGIARHDDAGFAATATDLAVLCVVVPPQPVPRSQKHVAALSWVVAGRQSRWRCPCDGVVANDAGRRPGLGARVTFIRARRAGNAATPTRERRGARPCAYSRMFQAPYTATVVHSNTLCCAAKQR
jgi:hypothetical protein